MYLAYTGIFRFLDINIDGHIDLSEIVRGMAMLCRASTEDRIRCKAV